MVQQNATRSSDYVVKGTIGAAGTGALVWGAKATLTFLGTAARRRKAARAEHAVRARRFLQAARLHECRLETREDGRDARYKTGRARVCATL